MPMPGRWASTGAGSRWASTTSCSSPARSGWAAGGGGLIVDGRLMTGAAGYAGEIGHLTVNPDGAPCRCGSVGCWETEVGERVLLARAGHAADEGREGIEAVVREAAAGSATALAAIDHVGRWLGIGIAGLVNVLNPRLVILGGPNGRLLPFIRARLDVELARFALRASRALVRVVPASLGIEAPMVGAAELAFDPLLNDPAAFFRGGSASVHLATA